jgi:hypothetical protein
MTGKRWAVAAAFCVLAAPGAFAQKVAPVNAGSAAAGPQSPLAAPAAPDAAKTAQFPLLLPDKAEAGPGPLAWSPQELELAQARCAALLKGLDAVVVPETPMREGPACGTPAPMKLISVGRSPQVALSPPPTVTCDMVATLARWLERDVQPLARKHLGAPIIRVETMSSYSCRNAYGRAHGRVSEHGKANAVDIGSFVTARGQAALVIADWGPTARQIAAQAAAGQAAADPQTKAPMQPVQGVAAIPPGDSNQRSKSAAAQKPPAAASAATVMPLDLRPGMTIGIPGITLDMPGSSDRSLSSFGMEGRSRQPPPDRPSRRTARRISSAPPIAPPASCSTPCSAPKPTMPTSTISTWIWPSASRTPRFASEFTAPASSTCQQRVVALDELRTE